MLSLPILAGIGVMLCWGIADVMIASISRRIGVFSSFVYAQLGMIILYLIIGLLFFPLPSFTPLAIILIVITGLLSVCGYLSFCAALKEGPVSIVSSIIGCSPVITVLIAVLWLGETITSLQTAGIILAVMGAVLSSLKFGDIARLSFAKIEKGALLAFITFLSWGFFYAIVDKLVELVGWFYVFFFAKVISASLVMAYLASQGKVKETIMVEKKVLWVLIVMVLFEFTGHFLYSFGVGLERSAVIAPIAFAYPIVAVIGAHMVFSERLEKSQYLGIAGALLGIILIVV
jgi:drug/metabolite transporter (DMT)-like permease